MLDGSRYKTRGELRRILAAGHGKVGILQRMQGILTRLAVSSKDSDHPVVILGRDCGLRPCLVHTKRHKKTLRCIFLYGHGVGTPHLALSSALRSVVKARTITLATQASEFAKVSEKSTMLPSDVSELTVRSLERKMDDRCVDSLSNTELGITLYSPQLVESKYSRSVSKLESRLVIRTCGPVYTTASLSNASPANFHRILPDHLSTSSPETDVSQAVGFRGTISPVPSGFSPAVITAGTKEQPGRTHKRIKQYASERQDGLTQIQDARFCYKAICQDPTKDHTERSVFNSIAAKQPLSQIPPKSMPLAGSVSNNGKFQQDTRKRTDEKDDVQRGADRTESGNDIEHTWAQSEWHRIDRLAFEREPAGSNGQSANRPIDVAELKKLAENLWGKFQFCAQLSSAPPFGLMGT
ncbi:hypothetical protein WN51_02645 [Melipona quadrifasciata]|uniref:Uncharacterized protein n=1 Tax=Melipona quadrifasciata TaxID=166423 RepID=A0A0M8ZVV1_9HYME|nr:hypothetical protein WN51_02645 [Melipona quadrifasciata]